MMRGLRLRWLVLGALPWLAPPPAAAQGWNDPATLALVRRAVAARERSQPDSSLVSYRARAHGFVFFLAQAGQDLDGTPRLIKADELAVDVYWKSPGINRQVIRGWRDGRWLPTDISYHRDHLGIVTNNFGDRIRIGEGDEVRDVPHPLSPPGPALYDYRLIDSVRVTQRAAPLLLHEIEVRPRDPGAPRVIGTLSLDAATGDLVRFRFSFTPAAYLDPSLEDITVLLESARYEGRWWLPYRQEIEIRRRVSWFDFPARSIIRGRWEIGDYVLNAAVPQAVLRGPPIGGEVLPDRSPWPWPEPLAEAVREAGPPVARQDLQEVRDAVERVAEGRLLSGIPRVRPGVSSLSDLAHVNRVQGLALGLGAGLRPARALWLRPRVSYGTSDHRLLGDVRAGWGGARSELTLEAGRTLRDLADRPPVSRLMNSLLSQEGGRDLGDYVLLDQARLGLRRTLHSGELRFEAGVDRSHSVAVEATPAAGSYRPNPALGAGTLGLARLDLRVGRVTLERRRGSTLQLSLEGGAGDRDYARATARLDWHAPAGPGTVDLAAEGGVGTAELPGYRSFAIGGWGTLLGEPFRAWGGRRYGLARLEYRLDIPFPGIPLGSFVSTGRTISVAPFLATGWTGGPIAGLPWRPSGGLRPVAGVGLEWLHRLIRLELGASLRTGHAGLSVDIAPTWWDIL